MKAKSFFAIIISLISGTLHSQDNPEKFIVRKSQYWNLSYSIGGVYDFNHNATQSNDYHTIGYNYNFDISYTPKSLAGFFANYSLSNVNLHDNTLTQGPQSSHFISLILGARFYNNSKNLFADIGSGLNVTGKKSESGLTIVAGAGGKLKVIDGYNLILRGSLHSSFFRADRRTSNLYFELSGGLELNNSKTVYSETVGRKSRYSIGLMINKISEIQYSTNFGIEASYNAESRTETVLSYTYYQGKIYDNRYAEFRHVASVSPRFYFGHKTTRFFFESGANLQLSNEVRINSTTQEFISNKKYLHFGFNVGTGAEIGLIENISAIVKANAFMFFSGSETFINYAGGLKYMF